MTQPVSVMLMVRELGPGGTERQITEIAKALDRSRFEVHVGCFHEGIRARELREAGVPVVRFPVRSFLSPTACAGAWQLGRYLRRHRIRIVHTFDYPLNCFGVPVAKFFRTPVVLSSQRADRALNPPRYNRLLRMTDHMVDGIRDGHATAVLAASIFHFGEHSVREAKDYMAKAGLPMRLDP